MLKLAPGRVFSLVVCLLLGGCSFSASTPTAIPSASPAGPSEWTVDFTRSGGFAGRTASMHLLSTGELTATDVDRGRTVRSEISAEDAAGIGQLLQDSIPFFTRSRPGNCADCFTYILQVEIDGEAYAGQATDADLGGLDPLVQVLSGLLDQALSGQP